MNDPTNDPQHHSKSNAKNNPKPKPQSSTRPSLHSTKPVLFACLWIAAYVVLMSAANGVSNALGIQNSGTAIVGMVLTLLLFTWIHKHQLETTYGLCPSQVSAHRLLYYIPLIALCTTNLWFGATLNASPLETCLGVVSMCAAGFLEEVIFRGLLFRAIERENLMRAIVISSATFGIGHLVNLLNGNAESLLGNLLQVCYAIAIGFVFVVLFHRTGSLRACIVCHAGINSLSLFANPATQTPIRDIAASLFLIVVSVAYAAYLWRLSSSPLRP